MRTVAALFVARNGIYDHREGVEAWTVEEDARKYAGPHPVVAHPPCERYGRYARGGPNPKARRRELGDDDGCFAHALSSLRCFGGVLEHPADSKAWQMFGIPAPPRSGGWVRVVNTLHASDVLWTCCVEQRHYGHAARKATWLLFAGANSPPSLTWGPASPGARLDLGFHSKAEREQHRRFMRPTPGISQEERNARRAYLEKRGSWACPERMSKSQLAATPPAFAELLLSIARSA